MNVNKSLKNTGEENLNVEEKTEQRKKKTHLLLQYSMWSALLSFVGWSFLHCNPPTPCKEGIISSLSLDPNNSSCVKDCDCNNQKYTGICTARGNDILLCNAIPRKACTLGDKENCFHHVTGCQGTRTCQAGGLQDLLFGDCVCVKEPIPEMEIEPPPKEEQEPQSNESSTFDQEDETSDASETSNDQDYEYPTEEAEEPNVTEPTPDLVVCQESQTEICDTGKKGECQLGERVCKKGFWSACTPKNQPTAETCNGKDNDCNGVIDDGGYCHCKISIQISNTGDSYGLAFGIDNHSILSANGDSLSLFDTTTAEKRQEILKNIIRIERSKDNTFFLAGGTGGNTTNILNANTFEVLHTLSQNEHVHGISISEDNKLCAVANYFKKSVTIWDCFSGKLLHTFLTNAGALEVAFSPDGKNIAYFDETYANGFSVYELATEKLIQHSDGGQKEIGLGLQYVSNTQILTSSKAAQISLWDISSQTVLKVFANHTNEVRDLKIYPDKRFFVSVGLDGKANIWDIQSGALLQTLDAKIQLRAVAIHPQNKQIATGGTNGIHIWQCQ